MKDGDYIHVQLPNGSIIFGDYHENDGVPFIRSYCGATGSTRNFLIRHVQFEKLASKFNPRNTFAGDVIIYNGDQRVVEAHVGHGVRITVTKNNKTSFVAFNIIEKNLSADARFDENIKSLECI